jgi:hypothetical protein
MGEKMHVKTEFEKNCFIDKGVDNRRRSILEINRCKLQYCFEKFLTLCIGARFPMPVAVIDINRLKHEGPSHPLCLAIDFHYGTQLKRDANAWEKVAIYGARAGFNGIGFYRGRHGVDSMHFDLLERAGMWVCVPDGKINCEGGWRYIYDVFGGVK